MALGFGLGMALGSYAMSVLLPLGFNYIDLFQVAQPPVILVLGIISYSRWHCRDVDDYTETNNGEAIHLAI